MQPPLTCHGDRTPLVQLNDGHLMPVIGLGTWKSAPGVVGPAILEAIKAGYRHFDCAPKYGNEDEIGEALHEALKSGLVKREELFITSKLWNDHHAEDKVPEALDKTLADLKLDYLDLYLIHMPATNVPGSTVKPPIAETWRGMQTVLHAGKTRSIGVSNFTVKKLIDLCTDPNTNIKPAVNQCELHPLLRQDKLLACAKQFDVHMSAYSPLGSPDSAREANHQGDSLMKHEAVVKAARELNKTPAQILLRWGLQRGTSVVPKSVHPGRMRSNLDVFSWHLPPEHMERLSTLEPQERFLRCEFVLDGRGPYSTLDELWDGDVTG